MSSIVSQVTGTIDGTAASEQRDAKETGCMTTLIGEQYRQWPAKSIYRINHDNNLSWSGCCFAIRTLCAISSIYLFIDLDVFD